MTWNMWNAPYSKNLQKEWNIRICMVIRMIIWKNPYSDQCPSGSMKVRKEGKLIAIHKIKLL